MRKIAIIKIQKIMNDWDYEESKILINSITDWAEVTDEELFALRAFSARSTDPYYVIEQPKNQEEFIANSVKGYLALTKKREAEVAAEMAKAAKKKQERELKKVAKTEAQEKALLEALQKKYKK